MPMKYIKVYYDWIDATQMLKDAEKGRLIDAMVRYAKGEGLPKDFSGNEQYVFPMFKLQLDRDGDAYEEVSEKRRQAGAKGGKQTQANASKIKQTQANASKINQDKDQDQDKDHDKDQDNDIDLKKRFDEHWRTSARARAAVAQMIIDSAESGPLGAAPYTNLHSYVCNVLKSGHSPEVVLKAIEDVRTWTEFAVWLSMHGGAEDDS